MQNIDRLTVRVGIISDYAGVGQQVPVIDILYGWEVERKIAKKPMTKRAEA